MKTIILFWNPAISDVSVTSFRMGMKDFGGGDFTWEVHSHDRVEVGDLCYLVRCDAPSGGIVLRGFRGGFCLSGRLRNALRGF